MAALVCKAVLSAVDLADVVTVGMDLLADSDEQLVTMKTPVIASRNKGEIFINYIMRVISREAATKIGRI